MPFIPHTESDVAEMLDAIGSESIDALFSEIPAALKTGRLDKVPAGLSEMAVTRLANQRASEDSQQQCFIGAGAYEHHIPAAVWEITTRGEFYTAYTPYQAEASQGTLQTLYEYQTMIASLTGMDVANASNYDGSTALMEAIFMAVRANRKVKKAHVMVPSSLHPLYREVLDTFLGQHDITVSTLDIDAATGAIDIAALQTEVNSVTALVIPFPNFFGAIEQVDALTDWAHQHNALVIAAVNPTALALFKSPGAWGEQGADIVCGDGQPLGVPLSSGGPYFGFLCCKKALVRQLPGRLVGRTHDSQGRIGYTLTLQAREQHIRRGKATSNICTNQGLLVTAATIYMSLLGPEGLKRVAKHSHHNLMQLINLVSNIGGIKVLFKATYFHECVLQLPVGVDKVIALMSKRYNIQAGFNVSDYYPQFDNALLVCVTETKSSNDLQAYADALAAVIKEVQ